MGVLSDERGLTMEAVEKEGKMSMNWAWLNFFGPYGTPPARYAESPFHLILPG